MNIKSNNSKIIVALDFDTNKQAYELVEKLDPQLCRLKIATTMYTRYGPSFVEYFVKKGFDIFLDLKFHDIPKQVAGAVRAAADLGVWMMTLHTQGGKEMMSQAAQMVASLSLKCPPKLVGVTVLTSLDDADIKETGYQQHVQDLVPTLAKLAQSSGLDGIVCSPMEVEQLRKIMPQEFLLVTPGIRLSTDDRADQKRVLTPLEAMQLGSSYLVIGRSITTASDPLRVLHEIYDSLNS